MPPSDLLLNTGTYAALLEQLSPGSISNDHRPEDVSLFSPRRENQKTLARLAQVCRTTSGPALAVLWRSIDRFQYLLYPFNSYDTYERIFTDAVNDTDWARFCEYAPCVRELRLSDLVTMRSNIWTILIQLCIREPLLPRLERLVDFPVDTMSACYSMLLSPSIRDLGLAFNSNTRDTLVRAGIGLIKSTLAQLTSLSITDWYNGYFEEMGTPIPLPELNHLQELRVKNWELPDQDIKAITGFPHLRVLHLRLSSSTFKHTVLELTEAFRSLRELELEGPLEGIDRFLQVAPPPALQTVSFVVEINSRDGLRGEHYWNAILTRLSLSSLRAFRATYKQMPASYDGRVDPTALLEMLAPFSHLESLILVYDQVASHLHGNCLHSIRHAWPQLTVFEVVVLERPQSRRGHRSRVRSRSPDGGMTRNSTPYYWGDPPPSITTLATFAAAHPHLTRLTIPALDLSEVPDVATVPHLRHGLRTLRISTLINDAPLLPFALALDLLFPHLDLRAVDSRVVAPNGSAECSQQLFAMLLAVQTGRTGAYRGHASNADVDSAAAPAKEDGDRDIGDKIHLTRQHWSHPTERWRADERVSLYGPRSPRTSPSRERSPPRQRIHPRPAAEPAIIPFVATPFSVRDTVSAAHLDKEEESRGIDRGTTRRRPKGGVKRLFRAIAASFRRGGGMSTRPGTT